MPSISGVVATAVAEVQAGLRYHDPQTWGGCMATLRRIAAARTYSPATICYDATWLMHVHCT